MLIWSWQFKTDVFQTSPISPFPLQDPKIRTSEMFSRCTVASSPCNITRLTVSCSRVAARKSQPSGVVGTHSANSFGLPALGYGFCLWMLSLIRKRKGLTNALALACLWHGRRPSGGGVVCRVGTGLVSASGWVYLWVCPLLHFLINRFFMSSWVHSSIRFQNKPHTAKLRTKGAQFLWWFKMVFSR